jgi:hypothetical protein
VLLTGLCLAGTAQAQSASPSGRGVIGLAVGGDRPTAIGATSTQECFYTFPDCSSSDPSVEFSIVSEGDTSGCEFETTVDWDDKSSTVLSYPGGADGTKIAVFKHTYADKPLVYTITVTSETTTGGCGAPNGTLQFTLGSPSSCTQPYKTPAFWTTQQVSPDLAGLVDYIEPLNIIISACSTVSLADIEKAMPGPWSTVSPTMKWDFYKDASIACISVENAKVASGGYKPEDEAWRAQGCVKGNLESLTGQENHARIWNQPVAGSKHGAWFITASYETACVSRDGKMKLLRDNLGWAVLHRHNVFHCIDGGKGSDGTDGYNRGAADFVAAVQAAGTESGWTVTVKTITRSVKGHDVGEDGVTFNGKVYVLTVVPK